MKENESEFREKHIQKFIPEPLQGKVSSDTVYDNQSIEKILNTFPDYISKKITYFRHFYQIRNNRHDMNIHYILESSYASEEIIDLAEKYLLTCAKNMYLYEDNNILADTTAALSGQELEILQNRLESDNITAYSAYTVEDAMSENEIVSSFPEYISDKVSFFRQFREDRNIQRHDFNAEYEVTDVEVSDNIAHVSLYEGISFYYDDSDQETFCGTIYDVSLFKNGSQWIIYDVMSNDSFDQTYRTGGFDYEAEIAQANLVTQEILAAEASPDYKVESQFEALQIAAEQPSTAQVQAASTDYITYDAYNAACYAMTYTTSKNLGLYQTKAYYNKNFVNYAQYYDNNGDGIMDGDGGDCQNFVSQCIWAGFGGSDDATGIKGLLEPMDCDGPNVWYGGGSSEPHSSSWTAPSAFNTYIENSKNGTGARVQATTIGTFNTTLNLASIQVGDEIIVNNGGHAIFIVDVTGASYDNIYYCAHTADKKRAKLGDYVSDPRGKIIRPQKFYFSDQTADGGNHTYSSVPGQYGFDSTCNTCGYCRLRLETIACNPIPVGTTLPLTCYASHTAYRMATKVEFASTGEYTWLGEETLTSIYKRDYTFNKVGLYYVTFCARDRNPDYYGSANTKQVSYTIAIRTY